MQVDPIKPTLKAPRIQRLKLIRDDPLSNLALNFNLRRYTKAAQSRQKQLDAMQGRLEAGAYTR